MIVSFRKEMTACWIACTVVLFATSASAQQQPPRQIAGRTLQQWAKDLDNSNEIVQARAAKMLGLFGPQAVPVLKQCLDHSSEAVRYWACSYLGDLAPRGDQALVERLNQLKNDAEHPACAMAAAYALCRIEGPQGHIELLIQRLDHGEPGMAISACDFLGRLGPQAKAAVPALERAARTFYDKVRRHIHRVYHVDRAAENALRQIDPNWKRSWPDPRQRRNRPRKPRSKR